MPREAPAGTASCGDRPSVRVDAQLHRSRLVVPEDQILKIDGPTTALIAGQGAGSGQLTHASHQTIGLAELYNAAIG
jgi:hypothetical protein